MDMVFNASDNNRLAIEVREDSAEIPVQFFADSVVAQERAPIFCRKYGVNQNFGERLRHDGEDGGERDLIQPFQGWRNA